MDEMCILCEAAIGQSDPAARSHAETLLVDRIKQSVGISVSVTVGEPESVARSQGKAVRIIDKR